MTNPPLPEEMVYKILSNLPAKSVGKFKSLSRRWNSIISSYGFIKNHQQLIKNHAAASQETLLLNYHSSLFVTAVSYSRLRELVLDGDLVSFEPVATGVRFLSPVNFRPQFSRLDGSSCHGLVLTHHMNAKFLLNPTTKEYLEIPNPPLARERYSFNYGFGYDNLGKDYKIVCLCIPLPDFIDNQFPVLRVSSIYFFHLKSYSWKKSDVICPYGLPRGVPPPFLFRGKLHWVAFDGSSLNSLIIASFDLATETFDRILPPADILPPPMDEFDMMRREEFMTSYRFMVIKGSLAMFNDEIDFGDANYNDIGKGVPFHVFIMKEYGLNNSWTKLTVPVSNACWQSLICSWGDLLIFSVDHVIGTGVVGEPATLLAVYSFEDNQWRYLEGFMDQDDRFLLEGLVFLESLLSPKLLVEG